MTWRHAFDIAAVCFVVAIVLAWSLYVIILWWATVCDRRQGIPAPAIRQRDQQQASDQHSKLAWALPGAGSVDTFHNGSIRTEAERNHG